MAKRKRPPLTPPNRRGTKQTKKPKANADKKTHKQKKVKQAIRPVRFKGNRKAVSKPNKTRAKTTVKKSVKLVSKINTIKKRKGVKSFKGGNTGTKHVRKTKSVSRLVKPSSIRTIKTKENKQTNSITFLSGGKPENVSKKFVKGKDAKLIKKYLTKNKPKKGAPAKEPRAVILIFAYNGSEGKKHYSVVSPDTMVVNADSIDKFISDTLENANDLVDDLYGTNLEDFSIIDYSIKFIY